ncbi:MAG: CoA transferase [Bacteriovoracaceae bacterium]|nr:CoA transferase [Bacteriovoracaceae bacterium]
MSKILEGLTIIDLSHRLPGPLAGHLLSTLGAKVIKVEDKKFSDPFKEGLFGEMDKSFSYWYQSLNDSKELEVFDYSSESDQEKLRELVGSCDGIIMGVPSKIQDKLGLTQSFFKGLKKSVSVIQMKASKNEEGALHDLNALAKTGLLDMHIEDHQEDILYPPFLPISGIIFGHRIAMEMIGSILKATKSQSFVENTCYLLEATKDSLSPFYSDQLRSTGETKFLHNGKFPCYALYRLKDGHYAALAAVEEKFWHAFTNALDLKIEPSKRFHSTDNSIFELISSRLKALSSNELEKLTANKEMCLNIL